MKIVPIMFPVILFLGGMRGSSEAAGDGKDTLEVMMVGGRERTYLLHLPSVPDKSGKLALVIVLHGGGGTGKRMGELTLGGFDTLSNKKGFIVVYPDGIDKYWNDGRSADETGRTAHEENIDDVGFISALIDSLVRNQAVDPRRVYVTGISNGALMSYRLGCELSEKIAAIAPVDGNIPVDEISRCSPTRPVSVLAINGRNDPLVPWSGGNITGPFGLKKLGKVLSVESSVGFWVEHDRCSELPVEISLPDTDADDGTTTTEDRYTRGDDGTEVVLYTVEGGGHTWPGGLQYCPIWIVGRTSRDFSACEAIWNFFSEHGRR